MNGAPWQVSEGLKTLGASCAQQIPMDAAITPDTVRSLLDAAHGQIRALEEQIIWLGDMLEPVRSPNPRPGQEQVTVGLNEPECIASLRSLIERITRQMERVHEIAGEVRI